MDGLKRQEGFTLIEVVIAFSIFAVGMLAIASLQLTSVTGNFGARVVTEITIMGQEQVEKLLALPYDHPDLKSGRHSLTRNDYNCTWVVEDDVLLSGTKLIQFDVSIVVGTQTKQVRFLVAKADVI